jgi:fructokinase
MILVCGEALIDLFVGNPEGSGISALCVPGGSPFNVALGLARLGQRTGFLSKLSKDYFGALLSDRLAQGGVLPDFLVRTDSPTTISVVATGPDGQPSYSFRGEGAADRLLTAGELPAALPDEVRAIAVGSYSLAVDPTASSIETLVAREHRRRVISVDPNLRPLVIGDVAAWRPRFERLLAYATIVKASDEDVHGLYGADADLAAIARGWLALGPALVVVTLGARGARGFSRNGEVAMPSHQVDVIDTVGAGDTFHAALLAWLDRHDLLNRDAIAALPAAGMTAALHFAAAAAAVTCTRKGADLPSLA